MATFSVEGIVLRHADYRENDRMLTLLTPRGRVDALARGCKRPKSPLLAASEVFTLGNYELATSKNHVIVSACLLRDSFYPLRLDIDRLACAAYMANLCEATVQPDEDAQRPFLLLARALGCLSYQDEAPRAVLSVFLLHYAAALGYRPRLSHCVVCGREIGESEGALFDIEQGGVLCPACAESMRRGARLTARELAWLREARTLGIKTARPPEDAPLPVLQAYLEARVEKKIPRLQAKL
ncbi:MAG: DNA repair protein RecO [Clostridia bacterium]|nr:DNA repair protein RecO [Clostridia bacterium]